MKEKIICIVGPTASGKTGLGVELAKKINAEIISADSMQIYKGLNIATAKVTEEEKSGIPHHLIDICDVNDKFSVADFKKLCYEKIEEIHARNKKVIIVGGTGLYISAIVKDMNFEEQEIDEKYRQELEEKAKKYSKEYVYDMLVKIDIKAAQTIHPNNLKRVIRALEIAKNTSKTKSKHMDEEKKRIEKKEIKYDFLVFYIEKNREELYKNIDKRVDEMSKNGIINEAKRVYDLKLNEQNTCMQAIGYKEFFPYFENKCTLDESLEKLKQETRKYAKRQMTWFKNKLEIKYLDGNKEKEELSNEIISFI